MRSLCVLLVLVVCACDPDAVSTVTAGPDTEALDSAQAAIASDRADRSCQVVLRGIERLPGPTGGYETSCTSGGSCWWVWQATVDVATAAVVAGSKVYVQYRATDVTTYSRKQAAKIAGAPAGFQRYRVRLDSNTISPGMSATSLQRARLDVLPYQQLADGSRVFDHNRVTGDFDTYGLVANNQWSIAEDASSCRARGLSRGVLSFPRTGSALQHGPLIGGGTGVIEYDLSRLQGCRGSSGGRPTWDITATVRFSPGGQQLEQSVRAYDAPNGVIDLNALRSVPFTFTVPDGAQSMEAWFVNTGLTCPPSYDSNGGANHRFSVERGTPPAIGWFGNAAASTSRSCEATRGIPEPIVLDGYIRERACSFVELDVWAPGITDQARPELLAARVEASLDGVALPASWLGFVGRVGNDSRYRYELPRDALYYGKKWSTLKYTLELSTDGVIWTRDVERTVKRDPTWCNPAWGSCS